MYCFLKIELECTNTNVSWFVRRLVEVGPLRQLAAVGFVVFRHLPWSRVGRDGLPIPGSLVGNGIVHVRGLFVDFNCLGDFMGGVGTVARSSRGLAREGN